MEAEVNLNAALNMENRIHQDRKTSHLAQIYTDLGRMKAGMGDMKSAQDYLEKSAKILKHRKNEAYYYRSINWNSPMFIEIPDIQKRQDHCTVSFCASLNDGDAGPSLKDVNRDFDLLLEQTGGK